MNNASRKEAKTEVGFGAEKVNARV